MLVKDIPQSQKKIITVNSHQGLHLKYNLFPSFQLLLTLVYTLFSIFHFNLLVYLILMVIQINFNISNQNNNSSSLTQKQLILFHITQQFFKSNQLLDTKLINFCINIDITISEGESWCNGKDWSDPSPDPVHSGSFVAPGCPFFYRCNNQ